MVYCGKPSRGCQMCRTRRIKCDETKPTCKQCAKSRRQCPGYKDEFDLVFRNETQATERRARKSKKVVVQKIVTPVEKDESVVEKAPASAEKSKQVARRIDSALNLPLDQQAACHFVANFVLIPRQGSTRGFMDYLPSMLQSKSNPEHLRLAFAACSYASLGNRSGMGQKLGQMALSYYTQALSAVHRALQDPVVAKSDATLAAILLFSLYENLSAKKLGTLAWGSHVEGAIQLVKARGKSQLRTKAGLMLFGAVRTSVIAHTHSSGTPPPMGAEWWTNGPAHDENSVACQRLSIRVGELRAEINRLLGTLPRTPENIDLVLDIIRRCQAADQDFVNWSKNLPDHFRYETVTWEDNVPNGDFSKAEVYPGRVDMYQDLWVTSVWNLARTSRILLGSSIVRCAAWVCAPMDYRTTPEYASAARSCMECTNDIIASVPYLLGWFSKRKHLLDRVGLSGFGCGDEDALKGLPGYFLAWPLMCVVSQDHTSDSQRAWVKGRLRFIADELGLKYAHMLTQLNLRIPSMLIRRDGTMANPVSGANFQRILAGQHAPMSELEKIHSKLLRPDGSAPKTDSQGYVMSGQSSMPSQAQPQTTYTTAAE